MCVNFSDKYSKIPPCDMTGPAGQNDARQWGHRFVVRYRDEHRHGTARHGMAWHAMAIKMMTGRFPLIVPDYPTWRSGEHNNRLTCGFGAAQDRSILLRRNSTKNSANKDSANPTHKGKFKPYPSSTPQPEIQAPPARPTLTTDTYSVLTSAFG